VRLKVTFSVWNLYNTYNLGNVACFNYSVFTYRLESAHGLWFKLYCQRWRTSRSQAVIYTGKVVMSQKWCYIEMLYQQSTNRRRYSYRDAIYGNLHITCKFTINLQHLFYVNLQHNLHLFILTIMYRKYDRTYSCFTNLIENDTLFCYSAGGSTELWVHSLTQMAYKTSLLGYWHTSLWGWVRVHLKCSK